MNKIGIFLSILMIFTLLSCESKQTKQSASLEFQQDTLFLAMNSGQDSLTGSFAFVNCSNEDINLLDVKGSCSCLVTSHKKKLIKAKQQGEIQFSIIKSEKNQLNELIIAKFDHEPYLKTFHIVCK